MFQVCEVYVPTERKNPPVATDFMESAQSFGNYNLAFSLADLIDNSITAEATQIDINDDYDEKEIRITVQVFIKATMVD